MNKIFEYIPFASHEYVGKLLKEYRFRLVLKNNRSTKLGDFRNDRSSGTYTITVNKDLNPYQFLFTFLHELAHLVVAQSRKRVRAHGVEWKTAFRTLVEPILTPSYFPEPLLSAIKRHMKNPKASAGSDPVLWTALKAFDTHTAENILDDLSDGDRFIYRRRQFKRIEKRRTRVLCKDLSSKRLYLIPAIAEIELG